MTADDPRDDLFEADPDDLEISRELDEDADLTESMSGSDPMQADEADRWDQTTEVPLDEDEYEQF